MKGKIAIVLGFGIVILVILTSVIYLTAKESFEFFEITSIAIVLILIGSATYIIWDRLKNIRKGLPAKDERLIQVNYKAGYYGFIAAIWSAVGCNTMARIIWDIELDGGYVSAVVVLVSGFVFVTSYMYLVKKGDAK